MESITCKNNDMSTIILLTSESGTRGSQSSDQTCENERSVGFTVCKLADHRQLVIHNIVKQSGYQGNELIFRV